MTNATAPSPENLLHPSKTHGDRLRWDLFCKVVDNLGDIGFCWRLARQLADEHGVHVRLWVDDLDRFQHLCPTVVVDAEKQSVGLIDVRHWRSEFPIVDLADVVIEAFACQLPDSYIAAMARRDVSLVWINLEYLSAESWIEDCHLLPSPQPECRLKKFFFFPGFTSKTGGLLRERGLLQARSSFDQSKETEFWRSVDLPPRTDEELRISLFCYENPVLPELLQIWANGPEAVRLLVTPGAATDQVARWIGKEFAPGRQLQNGFLTVNGLPFISQFRYDQLLWACDVNFVRGEDSFVRAQWAQRPFVWQIYPQSDNVHRTKLDAFLTRYLVDFPESDAVRQFWQAWNGDGHIRLAWRDFVTNRVSIENHTKVWAYQLDQVADLADNLARFVRGT